MKNWEEIETMLEDDYIEIMDVVEDYSGRAMFGDTTTGFKLDESNFRQACAMLDKEEVSYSTDSIGLNYIIY
jgi:hypothetical protein